MPIVKNRKGNEIVEISNLSEISVTTDGMETLQTTANTKLTSLDSKVSKGQDVKVAGSDLQQVLMYGRNNDGTLHPLECVGDRLIVDVIELSPTGPHTPTSLPSMAIHGQVEGTSGFKNLQVNTDGKLEVSDDSNRSSETDIVSATLVNASSQIGIDIDIGLKKSIIIIGQGSANHSFYLEHSNDNTNWYLNTEVTPVSHSGNYHFNVKVEDGVRYYRLMNSANANTFTLKYITL
tara:strand:+ start:1780 stop:2484 length:705 start_codon:yes stop_codon:yes gene_type:complete